MTYSPMHAMMMRMGDEARERQQSRRDLTVGMQDAKFGGGSASAASPNSLMLAMQSANRQGEIDRQRRSEQSQSMGQSGMDLMSMLQGGGSGIGGGMASPSFMGTGGAGFSGPGSIGGYSTGGILGGSGALGGAGASTAGASSPAFGSAGASGFGLLGGGGAASGAGGGAAGGGGLAGMGGGMGAGMGYGALIGGAKIGQSKLGSGFWGRAVHGAFGPSISQMLKDPKQIPMMAVSPMLAGAFGSDESIEEDPEWFPLLGGMLGT